MSKTSHIAIKGDLTMGHVADALKRVASMPKKRDVVIDFAATKAADSSAVAFMLNCLRIADERQSTVTFSSVPESILTLADIYGLKSVIADATATA